MGDLIKAWIVEKIGVVMNMDPQAFSGEVMDGTIIAQILLNYNIINETQAWQIVPTNSPVVASKNFKLIQLWLHSIGIQRATEELDEICMGKSTVAINLFYELYLKLHDKNGLFFAMKKRHKERLRPTDNRFDVCTVDEIVNGNFTELVDNDLCQQLVLHQDVIKWNQDRYNALREKYKETRERYSKYLDKKYGLKEVDQFGNAAEMVAPTSEPLERLGSTCSSDYDVTYVELAKEGQEASLKPKFEKDPKAAAEILKNIKQRKRREMRENEERVRQQKLSLMELWDKLLAQQEKELDECVSKKMLKQSTFEKQMTTKLFEVRQQTNHILANRRYMDDCALKKREDEFFEHVFLRDKSVSNQKGNYYVERGRMLELHRRLYAIRTSLYIARRDDMCKNIVENFVALALISVQYKEKYQTDPDEATMMEWGNLFIKGKSLVAYLADLTELVVVEPVPSDLEEIYRFEMDRQEALDERDFESYMNLEKPWTDFLVHWEEHSLQIELGMNVLSHNVNRVLRTKNPETHSPQPLPAIEVAVCVNGLHDCNVLPVLQKLLNKRKIRVIEMQDAVNACVEAFKSESGTECLEDALTDHTNAALAHLNKSSPKPPVPVKGKKQIVTPALKVETKSTQTLINHSSVDLSGMAEYGKLAYEALNVGDELTDNLLVVMLVEYIRSLNDLSGWALINYPNTLMQAALLEQALTGGIVPDINSDSGSIGDIADLNIKASEIALKDRNVELQQSKLLPDPNSSYSLYRTYLTAFITLKTENCVGIDCSDSLTPLEEFYLEQGCSYELLYENLELNTIKRLAKMIIGEYSIPPKTSQELFGDTLNYVEANLNQSAKFVGHEIKHQQETDPSSIPVASTDIPGDSSWQYYDIPFLVTLQIALATLWENLESVYVTDFKQLFFTKRILVSAVVPYLSHVQTHVRAFIARPDWKQNLLSDFQKYYNLIDDDMREDPEVKAEIHCAISKFRSELFEICDTRLKECQTELQRIAEEHWLANLLTELVNVYSAAMQLEIDRCCDSLQFLNDYYSGVITKMPCREAVLRKTTLGKLSTDPHSSPASAAARIVLTLQLSESKTDFSNTPFQNFIHHNSEISASTIAKFKTTATSIISKTGVYFKPKSAKKGTSPNSAKKETSPKSAKKATSPKKDAKGLPRCEEPDDDVKAVGPRLIQEWQYATNGEHRRALMRVNMLEEQAVRDMKIIFESCQCCFHQLFVEIGDRYEREVESVNTACEIFAMATEAEMNLQPELHFEGDRFYIDPSVLLYPDAIPPPYEAPPISSTEYVFTVKQLDSLADIFASLAPNGSILERSFVFVLQDLIVHNAEDGKGAMVPLLWQKLAPEQVSTLSKAIFGDVEFVNWKDFIIYNLEVSFPAVNEMLYVRACFRERDPNATETIKDYQFLEVPLWFEPISDAKAIRRLLFKLYRVDAETFNYTNFLLDFCKDQDVAAGFFKALTLAYGKLVCDNPVIGNLYVASIMEQRAIDDRTESLRELDHAEITKLTESTLLSLISYTVHVCDSVVIEDFISKCESQINNSEATSKSEDEQLTEIMFDTFEDNESVGNAEEYTNVEQSSEPFYVPKYVYIIPFEDVLSVLTASLPWHVAHQAVNDSNIREILENIYEALRKPELNNNVLTHELYHSQDFRRLLLRNCKFLEKPVCTILKGLVEK